MSASCHNNMEIGSLWDTSVKHAPSADVAVVGALYGEMDGE